MSSNPYAVKCPDCQGEMVSRKGKYGVFWGCKKFPDCKGTRDSNGMSKADREAERRTYDQDKDDREELDTVMRNVAHFSFKKKS